MKNITIQGVLGRDAQMRQAGSDDVCSFSVAVDDGFGQNKKTLWFDVSLWGKRGSSLSPHLTKGKCVAVTGDLSTREHDGKTYLTIRASDVSFARGQAQERQQQSGGYDQSPQGYGQQNRGAQQRNDDPFGMDPSIPF